MTSTTKAEQTASTIMEYKDTINELASLTGTPLPPEFTVIDDQPEQAPKAEEETHDICLADVKYVPPVFTIKPYIRQGELNIIQGDPSAGKSALACLFASHVTTGKAFLGKPVTEGSVGYISTEEDTVSLSGRMAESGGNMQRVFCPKPEEIQDYSMDKTDAVKRFIERHQLKMLIYDPYQEFLGSKTDMNKANEVRPILSGLVRVARETGCAIVILAHLTKDTKNLTSLLYRALGSIDLVGAARSVIHVGRNPESSDQYDKVAIHIKTNGTARGRGISFKTRVNEEDAPVYAVITGQNDFTEADLVRFADRTNKGISYEDEPIVKIARCYMSEHPSGGFMSFAELKTYCLDANVLGYYPYDGKYFATELNKIKYEIAKRDGIDVKTEHRAQARGVSIRPLRSSPAGYQTGLDTEDDDEDDDEDDKMGDKIL